MAAAEWFYDVDGEEHGPVTSTQLKHLAGNGYLQPAHLIWKEGIPKRVPARSVKGLFSATQLAAADAPPKAAPAAPKPGKAALPKKAEEDIVELEAVEEEVVPLAPVEEVVDLEPVVEEAPRPAPMPPRPTPPSGPPTAGPGGGFRLLRGGRPEGPYTLEDIRRMLAGGQLQPLDMVGVEIWLPVATLGGLLPTGSVPAATGPVRASTSAPAARGATPAPKPATSTRPAGPPKAPPKPPDIVAAPLPVDEDLLDFGKGGP